MSNIFLKQSLRELCQSGATLLWLEGTKTENVTSVKLSGNRIILSLDSNVSKVVKFERYAATKVGLQFWSNGRPGVLYRWDQVPAGSLGANIINAALSNKGTGNIPDDEPPPNEAA